ncbi:hypothetical protein EW146_g7180 [Bondarzewia mesenterica]|uniref:Integrase catalytic domain-containing protein n=1 Tax=Bondarzewia mesenterica TaxID=1095465 RepID=A0A4S4LM79_9AGAM|nr:hypothetical protein EW146_g7180 [Bondarzewia mesenterica]
MGPVSPASSGGKSYSLDIHDDCTSKAWAILLVQKSDAVSSFREWHALTEANSGHTLCIVCTDSGGEFTPTQFEHYLCQTGVTHQTSAPYTSAHISAVERLHHTLFDRARAMRVSANLPLSLWGECYLTAAYLHNCTATHTLNNITPDEACDFSTDPYISCPPFLFPRLTYFFPPPHSPSPIPEPPLHIPPSAPPLRRSTRLRKPSAKLLLSLDQSLVPPAPLPPSTPLTSLAPSPLSPLTPLPSDLELLGLAVVELNDEPHTWAAAQASLDADKWRTASRSSVPSDRCVIKCRPIFTIKRDAHNNPDRYKARLVTKGFTQIPGQDFTDTFSPVARLESQRLLLHLAAHLG